MAFLAGMAGKQLASMAGKQLAKKVAPKVLGKFMKKGPSGSSNQDSSQQGGPMQSGPMQGGPPQSGPQNGPVYMQQTCPGSTQQPIQQQPIQQQPIRQEYIPNGPPYLPLPQANMQPVMMQPRVMQPVMMQPGMMQQQPNIPLATGAAFVNQQQPNIPLATGATFVNQQQPNTQTTPGLSAQKKRSFFRSKGGQSDNEEPIPSGGGEARTFFSPIIGKFFKFLLLIWTQVKRLSFFSNILLRERNGGKYNKALHYTNMFPGLLTCGIVIFLILFILWNAIQQVVKKISFNLINLPDLPFSLNKNIMQLVYSTFYIITSGYLLFYIFFSYFNELSSDVETGGSLSNLDIVVIVKRIVRALYILWPISVIVIGSTIAKALYKMSCGGAKANIAPFGKVIDSTIVMSLLASVGLIILLKIKYVIDMLMRSTDSQTTVKSNKILAIIFNFTLIYFILRLITITFEEFASKELIFLLGRSVNEASGSAGNCVSDSSECPEKNSSDSAKHYVTAVFLCILAVMIIAINMKFFKVGHQVGTVLQRSLTNASDLIEKNPVTQTTK